jgi:hypothetical protein
VRVRVPPSVPFYMTYKPFDSKDRTALFMYVLDLNVSDRKKSRILNHLYEEYRIIHEAFADVDEYIAGIKEEDLHAQSACNSSNEIL